MTIKEALQKFPQIDIYYLAHKLKVSYRTIERWRDGTTTPLPTQQQLLDSIFKGLELAEERKKEK